ncbi:MAG: type II toxin-antitoxin system HicA family toxin [Planctomycetes bacterium]|nr:type II toxin-antitoxin system HicA family toxin [Planctomycetota bacterium]
MKLPRDLSGRDLAKLLGRLGYREERQSGSHIRLVTDRCGLHHVTVPAHAALRVGTLAAILANIAEHHGKSREELLLELFA